MKAQFDVYRCFNSSNKHNNKYCCSHFTDDEIEAKVV